MTVRNMYYKIKPFLPRYLQIKIRRWLVKHKHSQTKKIWPILESSAKVPIGWSGWPKGKRFALVLTHDVETAKGQDRCLPLMEMEKKTGFRSSFNFVPERYEVNRGLLNRLWDEGFEVGVHGLNHDGKLFRSHEIFTLRAKKINAYIREWGAHGFRSPSMHHNLEWIKELHIKYDLSTFDTDPFEPQAKGIDTIFPFMVYRSDRTGYVEMPYTLPQDFTLFVLMKNNNINVWKNKLAWIVQNGGMALLITHPDYMCFDGKPGLEQYPASYYKEFLVYIKERYTGDYLNILPKEVAEYFRKNCSAEA